MTAVKSLWKIVVINSLHTYKLFEIIAPVTIMLFLQPEYLMGKILTLSYNSFLINN